MTHHPARPAGLVLAAWLLAAGSAAAEDGDYEFHKTALRREGLTMGLDPALVLRHDDSGWPFYARLSLRLGGCLTSRLILGADLRLDQRVTLVEGAVDQRYELGPVLTVFLVKGWFARAFVHVARFEPFGVTVGGQSGYEFEIDRFSAAGFALGADVDLPPGDDLVVTSFSFSLYLTAYDLFTRRGRDGI